MISFVSGDAAASHDPFASDAFIIWNIEREIVSCELVE